MRHPEAIFVQLTTACNARCINCPHPFTYGADGQHAKGNMTDELWGTLVEQIKQAKYQGQVGLYLHHEPLLVKSLYDKIADINAKTHAFVVLSTNGALLNANNTDLLIKARPRKVHINVNSANKQQYEQMTGLHFETTFENATKFIEKARRLIDIEINCPVLPGVDTQALIDRFASVKVNTEFWATSRGGMLQNISAQGKNTRFSIRNYCMQPSQNFNVLWDGSVIVCCADWGHESKSHFPAIDDANMFDTYNGTVMSEIRNEFRAGNYGRYRMCQVCAREMGFFINKTLFA